MKTYTVNVKGNQVDLAENRGLHAYQANNITAIEIQATSKRSAKEKLKALGFDVLYVFE